MTTSHQISQQLPSRLRSESCGWWRYGPCHARCPPAAARRFPWPRRHFWHRKTSAGVKVFSWGKPWENHGKIEESPGKSIETWRISWEKPGKNVTNGCVHENSSKQIVKMEGWEFIGNPPSKTGKFLRIAIYSGKNTPWKIGCQATIIWFQWMGSVGKINRTACLLRNEHDWGFPKKHEKTVPRKPRNRSFLMFPTNFF